MTQRNKKENSTLKITFIITVIIASSAFFLYFYSTIPKTQHLPINLVFNSPYWMKFISNDTEKILMFNFTQIYQKTGNYSLFTSNNLIIISNVTTSLTTLNSDAFVSVLYQNPDPELEDLVLHIIKPKPNTYSTLMNEIELNFITKINHLTYTIYEVNRVTSSDPAYITAFITFENGFILYSENIEGLNIIKRSIDTANSINQFSEKIEVKSSMYLLLSSNNDELAFSYSTLPYAVNETASVSTSIRYENNYVLTKQVFQFNNTSIANKNLNNIKQANLNTKEIVIIDNFIVTNTIYDSNKLLFELRTM